MRTPKAREGDTLAYLIIISVIGLIGISSKGINIIAYQGENMLLFYNTNNKTCQANYYPTT